MTARVGEATWHVKRSGDAADRIALDLVIHVVLKHPRFDGSGAADAPVADGHLLDEGVSDLIGGTEALDMVGEKILEGLAALTIEDDLLGEQAMAQGFLGRTLFALGRDRDVGSGAIGPRRFGFSE